MASTSNNAESTEIEISSTQQSSSSPVNLSTNLEFWMSLLPGKLRELPIIRLAIPGSHNTMTYTIEKNNEIGPDVPKFIEAIGGALAILVKPIAFNWSINQEESVLVQLNGGIRYLDLRVAVKSSDNNIYFLHGLYGAEITQPLQDVFDWLTKHPKEVIVLDFQHFYNFDPVSHQRLIEKLRYIFFKKICPRYLSFDNISLNWLNEQNYQVLIVYRSDIVLQYDNLWPSERWPIPWPDTMDPVRLIDYLTEGLRNKSSSSGFTSQALLTPSASFIVRHPCGNLRRDLAPISRKAVTPWIEKNSPGNGGMNVIIADDVAFNDFQFSRTVIERNSTLM